MKYHLTITNNETHEILRDEDINVAIGGYDTDNDDHGFCVGSCSDLDLAAAILSAERSIKQIKIKKGTEFNLLLQLVEVASMKAEEEN